MSEANESRIPTSEEVRTALRHCWQPVARIDELKDGPRQAVVLGEPLAVFLTEGGEPAVVADRCPHRGASLSMGAVKGNGVQCPYHGWEWAGGDGACVRVPSLSDQRQIPPGARVPAFPAREQWGLVWTALEEPLGEPPSVPWFDERRWQWAHGEPFELPVSAGVMIENFRDVAHFAFIHRETLGAMPEVIERLRPERSGNEVTLVREMFAGDGSESIWESLREIRYHAVAPNLIAAQMSTGDGVRCLLHAARELGSEKSAHYWLVALSEGLDEYSLAEAIESEQRVYAEDRRIVATVRPPQLPLDPDADLNTLADSFTLSYRRAFKHFVEQALGFPAAQ